jgi:hypothetical protein
VPIDQALSGRELGPVLPPVDHLCRKTVHSSSSLRRWTFFRAGDYVKASRLLALARRSDPARAPLWAERASQVHAAARARAAEVAGPDDPRPLDQIIQARREAAGIRADDPAVRFIARWNAQRLTAARQAQSEAGCGGEGEPGPKAQPGDSDVTQPEAGS